MKRHFDHNNLFKKLFPVIAVAISQACFAAPIDEHSLCPTMVEIKKVGVKRIEGDAIGKWAARIEDDFGTKVTWKFVLGPINASTSEEALFKANAALNSLVFTGESKGPPWGFCVYDGQYDGEAISAVAWTGEFAPHKLNFVRR